MYIELNHTDDIGWKDRTIFISEYLTNNGRGQLEFDDSACMLVWFEKNVLNDRLSMKFESINVDSLIRKVEFNDPIETVGQLNILISILSGIYSHLNNNLDNSIGPDSKKLIKYTRDSLQHLTEFKTIGRKLSYALECLCFLSYGITDEDVWKVFAAFCGVDASKLSNARRTHLAVPDWMWKESHNKYEDYDLDVEHENIVYFYEWNEADCKVV